jgi:hypothetical protein
MPEHYNLSDLVSSWTRSNARRRDPTGKITKKKSDRTVTIEKVYPSPTLTFVDMHFWLGTVESHIASTGKHWKMMVKVDASEYEDIRTRKLIQIIL